MRNTALCMTAALVLVATSAFARPGRHEMARPTAHELAAIAVTPGERLWYHEQEFDRDPLLRATPDHVVILHLAPAPKKHRFVDHEIPYRFAETRTYRLCLPKKEPFLTSLEIAREDGSGPVIRVLRGQKCRTREIPAGDYRLKARHDGGDVGRGVGGDGAKAFVHLARVTKPAGKKHDVATGEVGTAATPFFNCNARYVFSAPSGAFPTAVRGQPVLAIPPPADTIWSSAWFVCADESDNVAVVAIAVEPSLEMLAMTASGPTGTDTRIYANDIPSDWSQARTFKLVDLGDGAFSLMANFAGQLYPVVVDANGSLRWQQTGTPTVFKTEVRTYYGTTIAPAPAFGEVALEDACFDSSLYWVFHHDVADFRRYTALGYTLDQAIDAVILAPGIPRTPAALFSQPNYGGWKQEATDERTCLDGTTLDFAVASMRIDTPREFIAATNDCQGCNLSGVDLSDLDLTAGTFQSSTFLGANLSSTIFQAARLDHANLGGAGTLLVGTDFISAFLNCTNFGGADLSRAIVLFDGIRPIVTTDFSCRLDLTGATLLRSTFPLNDWRYCNLTGVHVPDLNDTPLSTADAPLDLSGAILDSAAFGGVVLDHADLGCAPTNTGQVCTKLIGTTLFEASLKKANLVNALLQGANLKYANLDGANLCEAKLNQSPTSGDSASLQGAFLRNVNLAQADLTGAGLEHADFYSTTTSNTCNSAASCSFSGQCASAVNAQLSLADFRGAYLAGVDFAGSTAQGAKFPGALLMGSHFTNVDLSRYPGGGDRTDFTEAWLQGTTFSNATVGGADFTSALVEFAGGKTERSQLPVAENVAFPFYTKYPGSTLGCVSFTTTAATGVPITDASNYCPDGNTGLDVGQCTTAQWQSPRVTTTTLPPGCSSANNDWNWVFPN